MDFIDLIANIGGNLGLFIGVSFLSFAEIIELILEIFFYYVEKRNNSTEKNSINLLFKRNFILFIVENLFRNNKNK